MREPGQAGAVRLAVSCSVGVAFFPRDGMTPDLLIANSDRALYAAKKLGKDRYAFADGSPILV
jgi:GGDEF domain-containing protein